MIVTTIATRLVFADYRNKENKGLANLLISLVVSPKFQVNAIATQKNKIIVK